MLDRLGGLVRLDEDRLRFFLVKVEGLGGFRLGSG